MSKRTFDEPKSPPLPSISPGQQKRVRFLVDNNNDLSSMADHQPSILFRQDNLGTSGTMSGGFEEMENSRRITSNFLFGNTTLSYDFGLMNPMAMDQQTEQIDFSNNNITFVQSNQRTNLVNESGNDGTWLTIFGFRTHADALRLIDEFSRTGVIEKYVIVEESNLCHIKFETRLQAQRALRKHGHIFGQIMIGIRYCTDKDIIGLKPLSNTNVYLENPFLIRPRHRLGTLHSMPLSVQN